jgi:carbamoyltransferase
VAISVSIHTESEPLALGINWAHDSSVAVCSPSGILFSVAEERVTRLKHHYGFPIESIRTAFKHLGITGKDISVVGVSTRKPLFPFHENHVCIELDGMLSGPGLTAFPDWTPNAARGKTPRIPGAKGKDKLKGTNWEGFEDRHWSAYHQQLAELGLFDLAIRYFYCAHHRAHASTAFRFAGRDERMCIMTLDGKGDGYSGTIYTGHEDGRLELVRHTPAAHSLGSFYQAITEALGFVPVDGEYKTMGLAALGKPDQRNPFDGIVSVENGRTISTIPWTFRQYNDIYPNKRVPNPLGSVAETEMFRPMLANYEPHQFAFFAQEMLERNIVELTRDAFQITGSKALGVAGGVMLNVKANSLVRDKLRPSFQFIYPDSADSGLAAGAAMEALYLSGHATVTGLPTLYLGHEFGDDAIKAALDEYPDLDVTDVGEELPALVAKELVDGAVIGAFQGRLEMGPRALGNRSVMADPRFAKVKDRINDILKGREWFVPFAPMVLEDEANKYWDGPIEYRHMTYAVEASDYAKANAPGVVHVDGTMRPQVVNPNTSKWAFNVLTEFRKLTGMGVLINTSFNRHGLPIVGQPKDAIEHLRQGWVDGLAIGRYYVKRKA